ncbi:MAG: hypothetical protein JXQ75_15170 [Phycisphaerae bacterium]|nr:hypothetical protein [Phycisphaerae bacterium]
MIASIQTRRPLLTLACTTLLLACSNVPSRAGGDSSSGLAASDAHPSDQSSFLFEDVPSLASSRILIWFETTPDSTPVTGVELWYTTDRGKAWHRLPGQTPPESPIAFDACADGLYGFYLVLLNAAGRSAPPPEPGTAPQQCVRVDRSAPMVQILAFQPDDHFDLNREFHVRWTVQDDNLPDRPVKLHYRSEQTKTFQIAADLLAADSSYRWTVPEHISGRIEVKVSATDRAGNTGRCITDRLRIEGSGGPPQAERSDDQVLASSNSGDGVIRLPHNEPPATIETISDQAAKQAKKLYDLGTWHRLRGEHGLAVQRLREASQLNPNLLDARNDLAGLLFLQGDRSAAEGEYRDVLAADPRHQAALKGLALLQATLQDYSSSRRTLERLLEIAPGDAEAWLYFGDVTMFSGDRQAAWEAWKKAGAVEQATEAVKERARKRLKVYRESSATAEPSTAFHK